LGFVNFCGVSRIKYAWLLYPWILSAQNPTFSLSTATVVVGAAAGQASVQLVASPSTASWTAASNASWLHLGASSVSGTGSALVQFSFDTNPNPGAQTGTLTIAGQNLTVTQAGSSFVPVNQLTTLISQGLNLPYGVAVDSGGNLYIADTGNNVIREWSASTQQTITLVSAGLNAPHGIAVDGYGNVFIADAYNDAVEEWSPATRQLTTLVSSGLNFPVAVAVDGQGNVYIADFGDNAIKQWNSASGQVITLIETGLSSPTGVAVDELGNLYIADFWHNSIEQWNPTTQQLTGLVPAGLSFPNSVALDGQGNVYLVDGNNNALKEWNAASQAVSTLISSGVEGSFGIATDGQGNFYIANTDSSTVLKLASAYLGLPANINEGPQAGTDSAPVQLLGASIPIAATSDQAWLTITGTTGGAIGFSFLANTSLSIRSAQIGVLGQTVTVTQSADVPAAIAKTAGDTQSAQAGQPFSTPLQVLVTDAGGNPLPGAAVTFSVKPGIGGASGTFGTSPPMPIPTNSSGSATAPVLTANTIAGKFAVTASVNALSVTFNLTNLFYSSLASSSAIVGSGAGRGSVLLLCTGAWTAASNASWLQLSAGSAGGTGSALIQFSFSSNPNPGAQTGVLTIAGLPFTVTQAGAGFVPVTTVSPLVSSGLSGPQGVAVDGAGNVYIADSGNNAIKKWSTGTQQVSTLVSGLNAPAGVAVSSTGNVYFADQKNNAVKKWSVSTGVTSALVSSGLSSPVGVAVDNQGNVYFADAGHNAIDEWIAATGQVTTLVSSGLDVPLGVAVDAAGDVYFADEKNDAVKVWSKATKLVSTLVSGLSSPYGVAVDGGGNLYFADTGNSAIEQWSPISHQVTVLVSSGLKFPGGVAVDGQGNVDIADWGDNAIKKYAAGYLSLGATSRNEGASAGTDSISFQVLPAGLAPTAASSQPWLTITGTSAGEINFSFLANNSSGSRSAEITVLGQKVTVTQSGAN